MYRYQAIDKLYIIAMRRVINPAEIALSGPQPDSRNRPLCAGLAGGSFGVSIFTTIGASTIMIGKFLRACVSALAITTEIVAATVVRNSGGGVRSARPLRDLLSVG